MKIVQINSHIHQGGAARIALYIHRQLLQEGQQSYIAYGRGADARTEPNSYCFDTTPEILESALLSRAVGLNGWWNHAATGRLLRYLDEVRPDLIHLHALHGYYLNFNKLFDYINEKNIPCVWTFHDCHAFVGNCGYFFECDRWKEGCGHCPDIHRYPKSQFFDLTHYMWEKKKEWFTENGNRKIVVTPSDWLTAEAKQSFFGKYPCVTIHNGINTGENFYPRDKKACRQKYGYAPKEKLVLGIAIGYSDPRKGAKYILNAAKELEGEAKVILIGWEKQNNALLEGRNNVIALPAMESVETLAEYYSMADVFVLPSLAENYATVTLESMACGTPVVGFDAGGIPEQLTDNKGITVKAGDQTAFTAAIRAVLSGKKVLLRGQELAEVIHRENSLEKMVAEYRAVYETLLDQKAIPLV